MRCTATIRRLTLLAATALAMVAFAFPAWAATFTVDRGDDPGVIVTCTPDPDDCSLRQAISSANVAPAPSGTPTPACPAECPRRP